MSALLQCVRNVGARALLVLVAALAFASPAAAEFYGYAVLPYNTSYAMDMVCPNAGDVINEVVLQVAAANNAVLSYSYGSSLPLPADGQGNQISFVSGSSSAYSEYYFRVSCQTAGGCGVNWDVQYYCKSSTG